MIPLYNTETGYNPEKDFVALAHLVSQDLALGVINILHQCQHQIVQVLRHDVLLSNVTPVSTSIDRQVFAPLDAKSRVLTYSIARSVPPAWRRIASASARFAAVGVRTDRTSAPLAAFTSRSICSL